LTGLASFLLFSREKKSCFITFKRKKKVILVNTVEFSLFLLVCLFAMKLSLAEQWWQPRKLNKNRLIKRDLLVYNFYLAQGKFRRCTYVRFRNPISVVGSFITVPPKNVKVHVIFSRDDPAG
jgi:hypothetical protein